MHTSITQTLAQELNVAPSQVSTAVTLLDDGNTVPFIARYRKEATQGLDDSQLRTLETRWSICANWTLVVTPSSNRLTNKAS
jgi:Transcriptional accessory protein